LPRSKFGYDTSTFVESTVFYE